MYKSSCEIIHKLEKISVTNSQAKTVVEERKLLKLIIKIKLDCQNHFVQMTNGTKNKLFV